MAAEVKFREAIMQTKIYYCTTQTHTLLREQAILEFNLIMPWTNVD